MIGQRRRGPGRRCIACGENPPLAQPSRSTFDRNLAHRSRSPCQAIGGCPPEGDIHGSGPELPIPTKRLVAQRGPAAAMEPVSLMPWRSSSDQARAGSRARDDYPQSGAHNLIVVFHVENAPASRRGWVGAAFRVLCRARRVSATPDQSDHRRAIAETIGNGSREGDRVAVLERSLAIDDAAPINSRRDVAAVA
jgi:hypothetical protein